MTLSKMTLSKMILSKMILSILILVIESCIAECRLCCASFMLIVRNKHFVLNINMLNVVLPSVVAPHSWLFLKMKTQPRFCAASKSSFHDLTFLTFVRVSTNIQINQGDCIIQFCKLVLNYS
jgi:hypothetical protein